MLDIWAFGTAEVPDLIIDVTITHPMAVTHQPEASLTPGHAASTAEARKSQRYPAAAGRSVTPFAMETWRRLGDEAESLLQTLAAAASRRATRRGQVLPASGYLKRWRAALDAIAQRGIAMSLLSANYGLAGRPRKQQGWRLPAPLVM